MSTPISDIPDDVEVGELFSHSQNTNQTKGLKTGKLDNCKQYVFMYFAILIGLHIPIDQLRVNIPHKLFAFGDTPIQAFLIVVTFILFKLLVTHVG